MIGILIAVIVLGTAGAIVYLIINKKSKVNVNPSGINTVSLNANDWDILYSPNMPANPIAMQKGWYFDFPNKNSNGSVHYVMTSINFNKPISNIIATFKVISKNPNYNSLDPSAGLRPNVRIMIETKGDDMVSEFGRWWANPDCYIFDSSDNIIISMSTPLVSSRWSDVFGGMGTQNPMQFQNAIKNIGKIGFTFGGGNSFGHGINLNSGTAKFILINFKVS